MVTSWVPDTGVGEAFVLLICHMAITTSTCLGYWEEQ